MAKLIVGLGNPGERYQRTRHNVGAEVIRELERRLDVRAVRQGPARVARGNIAGHPAVLARPATFMNESGRAVASLVRRNDVADLADLLLVVDDLDLPLGALRLRATGSAGGHNGMKSVIGALRSQRFPRLRVGIGRPPPGEDPIDYVLTRFAPEERPAIAAIVRAAADAVECWVEEGIAETMNHFNRWRPPEPDNP